VFSSPARLALAVSVVRAALATVLAEAGLRAVDAVESGGAGRRAQGSRPARVAEAGARHGVAVALLAGARLLAALAEGVGGTRVPTRQAPHAGLADERARLGVAAHALSRALFAAPRPIPAGPARDLTVDALVATRTHARTVPLKATD
jgi:hypothetical protein